MDIIIYGAGKIGGLVYNAAIRSKRTVRAVWDEKPAACLQFPGEAFITQPDLELIPKKERDRVVIYICIFSPSIAKSVGEKMRAEGFINVIDDRSEISRFLESDCRASLSDEGKKPKLNQCFQCPARRDERAPCTVFDEIFVPHPPSSETSDDKLIFDTLGLLITTKCNLTCVGCNHLRDLFDKEDNVHFEPEAILEDLKKVVSSVNTIKSLVVVGGEALVHPSFAVIMSEILNLPKIGFIQLITNGSYLPKAISVLDVLKNDRVIVEVSGYGDAVGNLNIRRREKFLKILEDKKINYRYDETANWTDFGGFHHRRYSSEKLKDIYRECCFVSYDLFNGELHKCSRSAYGKFLGRTPDYSRDYVDVRNSSDVKALRSKLSLFKRTIPTACQHCDGTSTNTIKAGVQVVLVKRRNVSPSLEVI